MFRTPSQCTALRPHLRVCFSCEGGLSNPHFHLVVVLGAGTDPVDGVVNRVVVLDHDGVPRDDDRAVRLVRFRGKGVGDVSEVDDGPVVLEGHTGQSQRLKLNAVR